MSSVKGTWSGKHLEPSCDGDGARLIMAAVAGVTSTSWCAGVVERLPIPADCGVSLPPTDAFQHCGAGDALTLKS
jgi:hypothetical protein